MLPSYPTVEEVMRLKGSEISVGTQEASNVQQDHPSIENHKSVNNISYDSCKALGNAYLLLLYHFLVGSMSFLYSWLPPAAAMTPPAMFLP